MFDRPIGQNQGVAHPLAKSWMQVEAANLMVMKAAALYDAGLARARPLGAPALGVGNLTVGGTGKTPVAAWACGELRARGSRPALLLRGVGGDEARVHALLNPDVPVVADPDRVRASQTARGDDPARVDALLAADEARRAAVTRADGLRGEQKAASQAVAVVAAAYCG